MSSIDLQHVLSQDRHFLRQAFRQPERFGGIEQVQERYRRSHHAYQMRLTHLPSVQYDYALPVHEQIELLKKTIQQHQVVIVCGETGSGKTTQLPKICLELLRGVSGLIGHTQPRRLAARSVAQRIAEELGSKIGEAVGYKVRFNDQTARQSYIKLMTDGILLAETQTDRFLSAYDTIIIDEAHERSLNIDFLLGYLKQLLPKRPDLKLIITSATIDAKQFSQHFAINGTPAPVIEVSGRTYPVEIHYRPLHSVDEDDAQLELSDAIVDAADELARLGEGDMLVFLPGEREIREAAEALRRSPLRQHDQILPLFARLSQADQQKIFQVQSNQRRIILSTNVAETSLTVPGIRYVIDSGLARVKRYSARAKVEQLHIEKIAQAAARQRSGRCGRVAAGVCIRLYSEEDFQQRDEFTDPEILRSNLAAVILRMMALRLGNLSDFPFLQAPEQRYINDGLQVLLELGAVDNQHRLSKLGKQMARLPIDPKIARILLAAQKHDCIGEMLIIISALSVADPRERPFDAREAADKAHERFVDKQSDFMAYVNIWTSFEQFKAEKKSNKQLMQWCRQYFLSYLRLREWRELYRQLLEISLEMGLCREEDLFRLPEKTEKVANRIETDGDLSSKIKQKQLNKKENRRQNRQKKAGTYAQIHRALLTGLIANIGFKSSEGHDYLGARGSRFHLFPASALFKSKPKWVMAAQLTETNRLYARDVAGIEPEWIEAEAPHLVRYHYFEPHWAQSRAAVMANERITLYGLTVLPRRLVNYGAIEPKEAREIFIRGALLNQESNIQAAFFSHNRKLIKEVIALEHKSRKQDVLVNEEALYTFYNQRLPEHFHTQGKDRPLSDMATFEAWRKQAEQHNEQLLFLNRDDLMQHAADDVTENQFPHFWQHQDGKFTLSYRFEPHHPLDGVTLTIPLTILNRLPIKRLEWLVPGMIREKLQLYIKSLPKQIRRLCVPIPHFVTQFLSNNPNQNEAILPQLAQAIGRQAGDMRLIEQINIEEWQNFRLPEHCYFNIRVIDDAGQELAMGRNLQTLQNELGQAAAITFRDNSQDFERENLSQWNIGKLPENIKFARGKQQLTGYLGLQKEKNGHIALRLFDTQEAADQAHRTGVIGLMALTLREQIKDLNKGLPDFTQIAMLLKNINAEDLRADISAAVCDRAFIGEDDLPRNEHDFKEQIKRARSRLPAVKEAINRHLLNCAYAYSELNRQIGKHPLSQLLTQQRNHLIHTGFVQATPWEKWPRLPIYLTAMIKRIEKYSANPARDQAREKEIQALYEQWQEKINNLNRQQHPPSPTLIAYRWQIEELRISLFAQELKTPHPVSVKRLQREWEKINSEIK